MNILVLGASGFIGSAVAQSLVKAGHKVTGLGRNLEQARRTMPGIEWVARDLRTMQSVEDWQDLLSDVDIAINAAGALQTGLRDNVTAVQTGAMLAFYEAGRSSGLKQLIQISAAGVDAVGQSDFMSSKRIADAALVSSGLHYCILRPGLVIGRNCFGGSELLRSAAGLTVVAAIPKGTRSLQCAALCDVVAAVDAAIHDPTKAVGAHDIVEGEARKLSEIIQLHRSWLGFAEPVLSLNLPTPFMRIASAFADMFGWLGLRSPLRSNAVAALEHGIKGDAQETRRLLGREPLSLAEALAGMGPAGKADRWHSRLALIYPLALASLVALWFVSGILGLVRTDVAAQIVIEGGMTPEFAKASVVAGSVADLAVAAGLLFRPWLGKALIASVGLALAYLAGSLIWSAHLWLDPLGPMLKVLPILALTAMLWAMAEER